MHSSVNDNSTQGCGCDPGAKWVCLQHKSRTAPISKEKIELVQALLDNGIEEHHRLLSLQGAAPTLEAQTRKQHPVATGVLDYFPDAILAIAHVSFKGNEQHHADKPLHWDRSKSTDEADALMRHFLDRGTLDTDGVRHTAKMAWRALAMLQKEIEQGGR